jgi:hypothetical protein
VNFVHPLLQVDSMSRSMSNNRILAGPRIAHRREVLKVELDSQGLAAELRMRKEENKSREWVLISYCQISRRQRSTIRLDEALHKSKLCVDPRTSLHSLSIKHSCLAVEYEILLSLRNQYRYAGGKIKPLSTPSFMRIAPKFWTQRELYACHLIDRLWP